MPFDARAGPQRIAIVGGGIAGLSAALVLQGPGRVTLYEAEGRLGGHARTVVAGRRGDQPVDTGFIVFNHATYPHLGRLFRELEVAVERSDMSFGASIDGGRIEYALSSARALFAQPLQRPVAGLPRDAARHRPLQPPRRGRRPEGQTVDRPRRRARARRRLPPLLPAGRSAARSGRRPDAEVEAFPATLHRALLAQPRPARADRPAPVVDGQRRQQDIRRSPRRGAWRPAACASGPALRCERSCATAPGSRSSSDGTAPERFDQVVLACHSDQALRLLARAERGRAPAARRDPLSRQPGGPACRPRPDAAAPRLLGELGLPFGRGRRRRHRRDLLDEPPAEPARRRPALRHPEPDRRRSRTRWSTTRRVPPPGLRPRRAPGAGRRSPRSRERTAPGTPAPGFATAFTRTASPARCASPAPWVVPAW